MSSAPPDLTLTDYQTHLPTFEGPLDVLLRLIERQKLDISDVSLVAVTDQFLDYIAHIEQDRPDLVADFAAVGTRLTVLKSRSLLPRPPATEDDEEVDPDELVEQLKAYQRLKGVALDLGERFASGMTGYAPRGVGPVVQSKHVAETKLMAYESSVLLRAIRRRLTAVPKAVQAIRQRRVVSIREMTDRVLAAVTALPRVRFRQITADAENRTDKATAFLAVLVLIRRGMVAAEQDTLFGDIDLTANQTTTSDLSDIEDDFVN